MRVSKADGSQVLDLQRDALLDAGIGERNLYSDKAIGKLYDRPGLDADWKSTSLNLSTDHKEIGFGPAFGLEPPLGRTTAMTAVDKLRYEYLPAPSFSTAEKSSGPPPSTLVDELNLRPRSTGISSRNNARHSTEERFWDPFRLGAGDRRQRRRRERPRGLMIAADSALKTDVPILSLDDHLATHAVSGCRRNTWFDRAKGFRHCFLKTKPLSQVISTGWPSRT